MIEIVIFSSYGGMIPESLRKVMTANKNLSIVEQRMKAAKYVKSHSENISELIHNSNNGYCYSHWCEQNSDKFAIIDEFPVREIKGKTLTHYLFWDKENEQTFSLSIVEIDETKRWKITNYDGAESISYFDEPKLIDAKYNLCEWK